MVGEFLMNIKYFILVVLFTMICVNAKVDFEKDIKPIFSDNCISCHRKAYKEIRRGRERIRKPRGDIQLDDRKKALSYKDEEGKLIDIVNPKESLIYKFISLPASHDDVMPPKGDKLSTEQIEMIVKWMKEGANWPDKYKDIEYVKPKK